MTTYLIATDSDDLFGLLDAAIGGTASLIRVSSGQAVRPAVGDEGPPGAGEAEGGVVEGEAQCAAQHQQPGHPQAFECRQ